MHDLNQSFWIQPASQHANIWRMQQLCMLIFYVDLRTDVHKHK